MICIVTKLSFITRFQGFFAISAHLLSKASFLPLMMKLYFLQFVVLRHWFCHKRHWNSFDIWKTSTVLWFITISQFWNAPSENLRLFTFEVYNGIIFNLYNLQKYGFELIKFALVSDRVTTWRAREAWGVFWQLVALCGCKLIIYFVSPTTKVRPSPPAAVLWSQINYNSACSTFVYVCNFLYFE